MHKGFFRRLALTNIKKNGQSYYPYLFSCICTVMMFYIMHSISQNEGLFNMYGAEYISSILNMGSVIIGIFSIIFLFYTNSFLIKRRKKELGLYNILGLEKKHIGKMMLSETLLIALTSIIMGLAGGMLLYKLIFMALLKILNFKVTLKFSIPISSVITTVVLFAVIFTLSFLYNLGQVHLANPIELLKGSNQGEKEPKIKWLMVIVGVASLGAGYVIALIIESPLHALNIFFMAVMLVIIGTYALFTAGSIALLKALKRSKKYYYKTSHFTMVSGMIYRMKQNAVGLANICILCTAILIMISTTVSFFAGQEDILRNRFPKDIMITTDTASDENIAKIKAAAEVFLDNDEIIVSNIASCREINFITLREQSNFSIYDNRSTDYNALSSAYILSFIPLEDFNQMEGIDLTLNDYEVYILDTEKPYENNTIVINGMMFDVKGAYKSSVIGGEYVESLVKGSYCIVVKNLDILKQIKELDINGGKGMISYYLGFNAEGNSETIIELTKELKSQLKRQAEDVSAEALEQERESYLALYGGLLFLGIFLGILFMLAMTLIIYYKQISEGFEDKERFEIMQKVGMSKQEVKKAIKSQIIMIFSLPLITAVIHVIFSFKIITKILAVLNLTNVPLFILCTVITIAVFSVIYMIVYVYTAKTYYKLCYILL